MTPYKLVVFDWDGTLMDSISRIVSSMQTAAQQVQLDVPSDMQTKQIIGLSLDRAITTLFPHITATEKKCFAQHYKHQYLEYNSTPTQLFDYTEELLTHLLTHQCKLAVATGKAREGLQHVWELTKTAHYFHASRCSDEVNSKPDPQMLTSLLAEFDLLPHEAVMIGDASYDMEMAQRAGVDAIAITSGAHERDILLQYRPIAIVDSLIELLPLLTPSNTN